MSIEENKTSLEENKRFVRYEVEEIFNQGNLDVVDEHFSADYLGHDPAAAANIYGPHEFKQLATLIRNAFPDLRITIEDQIAERDKVVSRFTIRGTHRGTWVTRSRVRGPNQGAFLVFAPSGNRVKVEGIRITRIVEGKNKESWTIIDQIGMIEQLQAGSRARAAPPRVTSCL
jgi:predicted ester cyclase